jgi:predicted HTH transcriptional regulator
MSAQTEPIATAKAIAKAVAMAPRNVQVHIQALKALGLIERVGSAKYGHWTVKLPNAHGQRRQKLSRMLTCQ